MNKEVKKALKEIERREKVKEAAFKKGYRSRLALWFKVWNDIFGSASHLEWLGFYDEAMEMRAKYKLGPKEIAQLYGAMAMTGITAAGNYALHRGIYNSNTNTVYYGHIDNTRYLGPIFGFIAGMIYNVKEQIKILLGGYKEDAFGLPVCWIRPKNVNEIRKAAIAKENARLQQISQQQNQNTCTEQNTNI